MDSEQDRRGPVFTSRTWACVTAIGLVALGSLLWYFWGGRKVSRGVQGTPASGPPRPALAGGGSSNPSAIVPTNADIDPDIADFVEAERARPVGTMNELTRLGLPPMTGPRGVALKITASKTTEEAAADIGNVKVWYLCGSPNIPISTFDLSYWRDRLQKSLLVLRLIEEGRNAREQVAPLLVRTVRREIKNFGKLRTIAKEQRAAQEHLEVTKMKMPDGGSLFEEASRATRCLAASIYVLANIGRLDADLLLEWVNVRKVRGLETAVLETWAIDHYFRQPDCPPSEGKRLHMEMCGDRAMATGKRRMSRWRAPWDVNNPFLRVADVDTGDLPTIDVLEIPRRFEFGPGSRPDSYDIRENFRKHVRTLRAARP